MYTLASSCAIKPTLLIIVIVFSDSLSQSERCFNWPTDCRETTFASPNYPQPYISNFRKLYQIFVPTATSISLEFEPLFRVEEGGDFVAIGTGFQIPNDFTDPSILLFDGNVTPSQVTLQSDAVWIYFSTDASTELPGWKLQWSASKCGAINGYLVVTNC